MQLGDTVVVALEEGQEVLRQITLVAAGQGTDNAEIHGHVAGALGIDHIHKDIPGMHIRMEEIVLEHLGEKDLHAILSEQLDVGTALPESLHVADRDARDALHGEHVAAAVVPVYFRHVEHVGALEIAPQLGCVGSFQQKIQFRKDGALIFSHHLHGPQPARFGPVAAGQLGQGEQDLQILLDHGPDAGAQQLDDHLLTAAQPRSMHLGHGGCRKWLRSEIGENLGGTHAKGLFHNGQSLFRRKRRHLILELGQLVGDRPRQQVPAG